MDEKKYLYWLCSIEGIGAVTIRRIREFAGSFGQAYYIEEKKWRESGIFKEPVLQQMIEGKKNLSRSEEEYHSLKDSGIQFISAWEPAYPARLKEIYDYPAGIFVKGSLPDESMPSLAIVGARHCSDYGKDVAEEFAKTLSEAGIQIISGMAYGIDGAGHRGALKTGKGTFAVLGCGLNICYPREHYRLYREIPAKGGLISEYLPSIPPKAAHFPMRNRIISGLSQAVLVIEAAEKSGSLITAELALEQGREVFAIPGRITDVLSQGCNRLIQSGAGAVNGPEDILDYFHLEGEKLLRLREKSGKGLAKTEKMVYSCLDLQPKSLEMVVAESGASVGECMIALYELEKMGYITRAFGQYYEKKLQVRG
ncbi:DNA-processing protein DprA [Lachnospiraceae bacterium 62-35]